MLNTTDTYIVSVAISKLKCVEKDTRGQSKKGIKGFAKITKYFYRELSKTKILNSHGGLFEGEGLASPYKDPQVTLISLS